MLIDWLSDMLSDLRYRFRALFRRGAMERELDEELRFHLEHEARKLTAKGLAPDEAIRRARLAFGGLERIKDDTRDVNGVSWLETFLRDVRYAVRGLRAKPGFAAAVVLTLGLGIGANVAMFGIVDRLLLRVPPYLRDADRVHRVYLTASDGGAERTDPRMAYARYLDLARWTSSYSAVAAFHESQVAVGVGEETGELSIDIVSASFFDFFDARPVMGRFFTTADDRAPAGSPVVVLSYAYWQTRYGGQRDAIGTALQIGPVPFTIIGVAPRGFTGIADAAPAALFIPITAYVGTMGSQQSRAGYFTGYNWSWMSMLVRRKPGVSIAAANADLTNAFIRSWESERATSRGVAPAETARPRATAAPVVRNRGPNASPVATIAVWVAGVAGVVLLIACANVANLLLARSLARRREMALRTALGASRGRLLGQLFSESLLLAVLGGAAGILAAQWGGAILSTLFLPDGAATGLLRDGRTLVFTGAAVLAAGILIGLAPALDTGRGALVPALKSGTRDGTYQRSRLRTLLLVLQGALSVVLLVGAGLFVRSLQNVRAVRLGYDVDPVLVVHPNLRGTRLDGAGRAVLARRLLADARAMPEVSSAALGISVPFWSTELIGFAVPGVDSVRRFGQFTMQSASGDYFRTMGTRILRGRALTDGDRAASPRAAVVSEGMAAALWPGKDPIGQCIQIGGRSDSCTTVVGVAEDIRQNSLTEPEALQYYLAIEQFAGPDVALFVRVRGDAQARIEAVRRRLQKAMPGAGYVTVTPMREVIDSQQQSWRLGATMFAVFGALALVLAAVGLYGVIAYTVAQRTQEIGVRIALGARDGDVVRLVFGDGVRVAAVGILVGGAAALWASRWMEPLLFSVSPRDPVVYGIVAAVLLAAAALASLVPAVRASRVDPNVALRGE